MSSRPSFPRLGVKKEKKEKGVRQLWEVSERLELGRSPLESIHLSKSNAATGRYSLLPTRGNALSRNRTPPRSLPSQPL